MATLTLTPVEGMPLVKQGDNLAQLLTRALEAVGLGLAHGDIVVICQKIVSKSEGRLVDLKEVEPSELAINFAKRWDKDPRAVEVVLRQTSRIVRMDRAVLIVETGPGWVCANAGVDESNSMSDDCAILITGRSRRLGRANPRRVEAADRGRDRGANH